MRQYIGRGAITVSLAALLACGSSNSGSPAAADGGGSAPTSTLSGHDSNPDGVPYPKPTSGYGRNARSGSTAGSVMANYKFRGYPNGDMSQGLQTIALADYYDPCGKRYKMIHLSVAGLWCEACDEETNALVGAKSQLASEKVVVLQAVDEGAMENVPATQSDLDRWVTAHKSNFTTMLDPGLENLSGFFNPESIPWNCDLDPRTMEIIDDSVGWAGDVTSETRAGLAAIPSTPSYPVPTCP
jgi:hypothetical protein